MTRDELIAELSCCAKPELGSNWAFGFSGPTLDEPDRSILRVDNIHCVNCHTRYEVYVDAPLEQVQRDAVALRIVPVKRKPS